MKKFSRNDVAVVIVFFAMCVAAGAIILYRHARRAEMPMFMPAQEAGSVRQFMDSEQGYSFTVPSDWYIDADSSGAVAVYPDYDPDASSSVAACKIEISVFPYEPHVSPADWISKRLNADPSVDIEEQSSEAMNFGDGAGIKWIGSIDDIPATMIYAFGPEHAYEIATSAVGDDAADASHCFEKTDAFLQKLSIPSSSLQ